MENYDFALDTDKIESIISDLETEKTNMDNAITNIYQLIDDMQDYWEGESYDTAKTNFESYHDGLNSSVVLVDKIISILNGNRDNADIVTSVIKNLTDSEE